MKRWLIVIIVVAAVAGVAVYSLSKLKGNGKQKQYKTSKVERGEIIQTIKATGTVEPILVVEVGTQVNGRVKKLYVDYNSRVTDGQIVAEIDPTEYQARVDQDKAALQLTLANVEQTRAKLKLAEQELARDRELSGKHLVTGTELDTSVSNRNALRAQLKNSQAAVQQARATLRVAETDLAYTIIHSPVNGVVIARNVNVGQTVVASFSAQTIFSIATDLRKIQIEAAVPEADIGKIKSGQPVTFTVDAFPDQDFQGQVSQVRLSATTTQNVVTYPVIITADNPEELLMPSMTANVSVEVARHQAVLKVLNSALRFKPEQVEGEKATTPETKVPAEKPSRKPSGKISVKAAHNLWIQTPTGLSAVPITLGISDGSYSEILTGNIKEGQEVVISVIEETTNAPKATTNPFAPKMPQPKKSVGK